MTRVLETLAALWAFLDVGVVIAVPVLFAVLVVRGRRPAWQNYAIVLGPYLLYAAFAGRMPFATTYVLIVACLAPGWVLGTQAFQCAGFGEKWLVAAVVIGVIPAILLAAGGALRRRVLRQS